MAYPTTARHLDSAGTQSEEQDKERGRELALATQLGSLQNTRTQPKTLHPHYMLDRPADRCATTQGSSVADSSNQCGKTHQPGFELLTIHAGTIMHNIKAGTFIYNDHTLSHMTPLLLVYLQI